MTKTAIWNSWKDIKSRCLNKNCKDYKHYGGRGITICERWFKFENFLEDMGISNIEMTIERIDNEKGYFKENCQWIHYSKQNRNKRTNINITHNGQTMCLKAWSEILKINYERLYSRIRRLNWTVERAFNET